MLTLAFCTPYHVTYPSVPPVLHAIGRYEYACGRFVESVISAIMLFSTPMLPLSAPFKLRLCTRVSGRNQHKVDCTCLRTAPQNVVDRPKQYIDSERPNNPVMMTGLRPMWSDRRLQ